MSSANRRIDKSLLSSFGKSLIQKEEIKVWLWELPPSLPARQGPSASPIRGTRRCVMEGVPLGPVIKRNPDLLKDVIRTLGSGGLGISANWYKVALELSKQASYNMKIDLDWIRDIEAANPTGPTRATEFIRALTEDLDVSARELLIALRGALLERLANEIEKVMSNLQNLNPKPAPQQRSDPVSTREAANARVGRGQVIKVLLLSSDSSIDIPAVMHSIHSSLVSLGTGLFEIQLLADYAMKRADLIDRIRNHKPQIVQFLVPMDQQQGLVLNEANERVIVPPAGIEALFDPVITENSVHCVMFLGGGSHELAAVVARRIPYTVGIKANVAASFAAVFSAQFYNSLARGDSFGKALIVAKANLAIYALDASVVVAHGNGNGCVL